MSLYFGDASKPVSLKFDQGTYQQLKAVVREVLTESFEHSATKKPASGKVRTLSHAAPATQSFLPLVRSWVSAELSHSTCAHSFELCNILRLLCLLVIGARVVELSQSHIERGLGAKSCNNCAAM